MIFPGGLKSHLSIEDLKAKFKQEYPTDQLISIPVVKLQDYRSVPVHLTEDDVRANIKMEEEEILQERTPLIRAKKQEILNILNFWQNNFQSQRATHKAAEDLNDLLFEFIFTGDKDCTCPSCQTKSCTHTNSKRCNINKDKIMRVRRQFQKIRCTIWYVHVKSAITK